MPVEAVGFKSKGRVRTCDHGITSTKYLVLSPPMSFKEWGKPADKSFSRSTN